MYFLKLPLWKLLLLGENSQEKYLRWRNCCDRSSRLQMFFRVNDLYPKMTSGSQFDLPCGFLKIVSSKQRMRPWFFVTFKIIIRYIFPKNFIEIHQVVQMLWRISLSILAIFIDFYQFLGFFEISLLQRN